MQTFAVEAAPESRQRGESLSLDGLSVRQAGRAAPRARP
jgi:hypothetical protein